MGQYNCKYPAVVSETVALVARLIALTLASIATKINTTVFILGLHLSVAQTVYRLAVIKSHFTHTAIHAVAAAASAAIDLSMVTVCSRMAWYKVVELMRELGLCEISDESDYCLDGDLGIWVIVINYCIFLVAIVVYHISAWRLVLGGLATADDPESQPLAVQSDTPTGLANGIVNNSFPYCNKYVPGRHELAASTRTKQPTYSPENARLYSHVQPLPATHAKKQRVRKHTVAPTVTKTESHVSRQSQTDSSARQAMPGSDIPPRLCPMEGIPTAGSRAISQIRHNTVCTNAQRTENPEPNW